MKYVLEHTDGYARAGNIHTSHGSIETPAFMPVGTQGTVKAIAPNGLRDVGSQIILGNAYHLYLRPGLDVIRAAGGLHQFMGWDGPILTDSGGYQVFSLADLKQINNEGVQFRSHLDGSLHHFTPEFSVETQRVIGADIIMVLDECIAYPSDRENACRAHELTLRWAKRCKKKFEEFDPVYGHQQSLFAIVQGGVYPELRKESAEALGAMGFEGYAIGGLSVGEPVDLMYEMTEVCASLLPSEKPRYLMGVGTPQNLLESIERGVDMFDCVLPTRNGRNAELFTSRGTLSMKNVAFKYEFTPIDECCNCYLCKNFTRSYLRHLFIAKEILALQLATLHNLTYYHRLMREARTAIARGEFVNWKKEQFVMLETETAVI